MNICSVILLTLSMLWTRYITFNPVPLFCHLTALNAHLHCPANLIYDLLWKYKTKGCISAENFSMEMFNCHRFWSWLICSLLVCRCSIQTANFLYCRARDYAGQFRWLCVWRANKAEEETEGDLISTGDAASTSASHCSGLTVCTTNASSHLVFSVPVIICTTAKLNCYL